MHRLDRAIAAVPACLARFMPGRDNWSDVSAADRAQIRAGLEQMQGRRCAYCEGDLDALGHHIEHFRRKGGQFAALTFAWDNLYGSCDQPDSCGHYKDNGAGPYNVGDLIEPCVDDPDEFFRFRSDGTISIRPNLTLANQHRAEETLRVFNLNPQWGRLRNMRKAAVAGYLSMVDPSVGFSVNEWRQFFVHELERAAANPFRSEERRVRTG